MMDRKLIKKKVLNLRLSGSYTVEMSLIMPFVLAVILLVIYAAIYSHDMVVRDYNILKAVADECEVNCNRIYEDSIRSRIYDVVSDRTAAKWYDEVYVEIVSGEIDGINIDTKGMMSHSQSFMDKMTNGRVFGIRNKIYHMNVHEPDWIEDR